MTDWTFLALFLSALCAGLSAGALLAEGFVLVPFWRRQPPGEFLGWYAQYGGILVRFFGPLEVATLFSALPAAVLVSGADTGAFLPAVLSLGCSVAVLLSFPLYFRSANEGFASRSIPEDSVADELQRWGLWHHVRTVIAVAAFVAAVLAVGVQAGARIVG